MTFSKQTQSGRALTGINMLTQPAKNLFFVCGFFFSYFFFFYPFGEQIEIQNVNVSQ